MTLKVGYQYMDESEGWVSIISSFEQGSKTFFVTDDGYEYLGHGKERHALADDLDVTSGIIDNSQYALFTYYTEGLHKFGDMIIHCYERGFYNPWGEYTKEQNVTISVDEVPVFEMEDGHWKWFTELEQDAKEPFIAMAVSNLRSLHKDDPAVKAIIDAMVQDKEQAEDVEEVAQVGESMTLQVGYKYINGHGTWINIIDVNSNNEYQSDGDYNYCANGKIIFEHETYNLDVNSGVMYDASRALNHLHINGKHTFGDMTISCDMDDMYRTISILVLGTIVLAIDGEQVDWIVEISNEARDQILDIAVKNMQQLYLAEVNKHTSLVSNIEQWAKDQSA